MTVSSFGDELRRRRILSGLSLTELATRTGYSKSHLSKIESGRQQPTPGLARRCDAALKAEGGLIALAAMPVSSRSNDAATPPFGPEWAIRFTADGDGGFGTNMPDDSIRLRLKAVPGYLEAPGDVEAQSALLDATMRLGQTTSPAAVLPVAIAQVHTLRAALPLTRGRSRAALLRLAARTAEFTGWMAQEVGDDNAALWWTDRAVELAVEGEDHELAEYADVRRALVTLYEGQPGATVRLAARVRAAHDLSPRVRWLAALREAQGYALAGENNRCAAALDHADILWERAGREGVVDTSRPLGTSVSVDLMNHLIRGWCLHDLGRPEEAAELFDRSSPATAAGPSRRSRVRFAVRQALALADSGATTQACAVVAGVLHEIRIVDSATVRTDLKSFVSLIRRRRAHSAVAELWSELPSLLEPR
ncbi:helix-turn-helix domain-containing protein [Microbispora hainanensis]|jgi:transcriptional regulator with XRE-family HTH domain|uniref:Helix-turn-helix domain-containing protein n=1 Tax=Microbispora hainanensis TaxID=568844 RepID=A0ABZ1SLK2_9ACTN|nr:MULTISPECIES: helix-turn-helix transcriptional regulator [Microbispora]NJP29912.1 helix-turn-helix domain-containing protein [Microbispora sp. CL1-1]TQS03555.1 helix-turn-helix domain-containing protein [Microbispora sp. SCL1-1]